MLGSRLPSSPASSRAESWRRDDEIIAGKLYWLPAKECHDTQLIESSSIADGCFDHPVVVLKADKKTQMAEVFIVTSLRGKSLEGYVDCRRRNYLAIYPAEHPDNSAPLVLDDHMALPKNSYVTINQLHSVRYEMLKPYRGPKSGKHFKLRTDSYVDLVKHAPPSLLATIPPGLPTPPALPGPVLLPPPYQLLTPLLVNNPQPKRYTGYGGPYGCRLLSWRRQNATASAAC